MNPAKRFPVALGLSLVALIVIASAVGAGYVAATGSSDDASTQAGSNGRATPTPSATATEEPTATPAEETPSPTPGEGSDEDVQGRLIFAEFGTDSDRILSFDPLSGEVAELASIAHFPNYGITGSVSSRGAVAYLALPGEISAPNVQLASFASAELSVVDAEGSRSLAGGFDPRQAPLWNPDGTALAVRSLVYEGDGPASYGSITLVGTDGSEQTLVERSNIQAIAAAGFSDDGRLLYFAETRADGETVIQQVDVESGATSEIARGRDYIELVSWTVGDGQLAAIVLQDNGRAELGRAVVTLSLAGSSRGQRSEVAAGRSATTFSPAWSRAGLTFALEPGATAAGVQLRQNGELRQLTSPGGGFDAPRFWALGLNWLAGLRFSQFPPSTSGVAFVLLDDGRTLNVPVSGEVTLFGWR